jgi:hypothetical protein
MRVFCLLLVCGPLALQSTTALAKRRRAPVAQPVINRGARTAAPAPAPELTSNQSQKGVVETVLGWHRKLAVHLTSVGAWAAMASPVWLPMFLWLIVKLVRRRGKEQPDTEQTAMSMPVLSVDAAPPVVQRKLDPAEALMLAAPESPSLYETLIAVRPTGDSLLALRKALASVTDRDGYRQQQQQPTRQWIDEVRGAWTKGLARLRVYGWLADHPLVTAESLVVQMPDELDAAALDNLALLQTSGLAVKLDGLQEQLLRNARRALAMVYRSNGDPYLLRTIRRSLDMPALLFGPDDTARDDLQFWLSLALFGEVAHKRITALGNKLGENEELGGSLAKHRASFDEPITAEGFLVALFADAPELTVPGTAGFFASIAGAAFSPAAVALQLSKRSASLQSATKKLLGSVGREVANIFGSTEQANQRAQLLENFRRLLGKQKLQSELAGAKRLLEALDSRPLWPDMKAQQSPDLVLARLHLGELERALSELEHAANRLQQVFAKLAYAGSGKRDREIAAVRLGYAVSSLGPAFLSGTDQALQDNAKRAAEQLRR